MSKLTKELVAKAMLSSIEIMCLRLSILFSTRVAN